MPNQQDIVPDLMNENLETDKDELNDEKTLHEKIDTVIGILNELKKSLDDHKKNTKEEIQELKEENSKMRLQLSESEDQAMRMRKDIQTLKSKCEDLELRSMSENVVFYNIPEKQNEEIYKVVQDVLVRKMNIENHLVHSEYYPTGLIQVDVAHRIGKFSQKPRPVVVKLVLRRGKEIILKHARNLRGSGISVSEQLPAGMRERRNIQLPMLRDLRDQHRDDPSAKIVLRRDQLTLNNAPVASCFEKNPLPADNFNATAPISYNTMFHSDVKEYSGSSFQSHLLSVNNHQEAAAAHRSLLQHPRVAKADHIMYAYVANDHANPDSTLQGFSDDGEYGGSRLLMKAIQRHSLSNVFLAVSRHHEGPNIGKKTF